jgi:hypothetical protein
MTDEIKNLIAEMDEYCTLANIEPKTLSRRAAGTGTFYDRLKDGGDCTFGIAARVRAFMSDNPPQAKAS